jgi:subtilase family serine protease
MRLTKQLFKVPMFNYFQLMFLLLSLSTVFSHSPEWVNTRKVLPDERVKFTLYVGNSNVEQLESLYKSVGNPYDKMYGKFLDFSTINKIINPLNDTYPDIVKANEFYDFSCKFYGDSFRCEGSVETVENVWKVKLFEYKNRNVKIVRSNVDYTIPPEYSRVKFVDGLSTHLFPLKNHKVKPKTTQVKLGDFGHFNKYNGVIPDERYFGRETRDLLYNISYKPSHNLSVVAWEFMEGGFVQDFMETSEKYNGVSLREVTDIIGTNQPDDVETDLDLEMMLNYDGVMVYYGETDGWLLEGYYDMLDLALVHKLPDVISMSYGWSEYDQCSVTSCNNVTSEEYVKQVNLNFLKLGLMGYTLVVSSGDAGSKGRTDETCQTDRLNPDFPGSSPYVVSVGATFSVFSNNSVNFSSPLCEQYGCVSGKLTVPVSFDYVQWTSGGNFDGYVNATDWELQATTEYLNSGVYLPNSSWNFYGHGVPTVTMNGHNCPVYGANGQSDFSGIDGTSCSAPMFAGFLAYINDFQLSNGRNKVGPAQQLLYLLAYSYPESFMASSHGYTYCTEFDCCTVNDGFQTPPKKTTWNPVYGLGQPNFGLMTWSLNQMFD